MQGGGASGVAWRNIAIFIVLALGLGLGPYLLAQHGVDQLVLLLTYTSPLLAALVVRKVVAREGFADAHLGIRGVKARYWLLAALLPIAWNTAGALYDVLVGSCQLHVDVVESALPGWLRRRPAAWAVVALVVVFEELGWRSYLAEKLRPTGPAAAFAICGLVWFSWHPQVWFGVSATWQHGLTSFIDVMCLSFVFGWLYYASGSVWPCLVMHVSNNTMSPDSLQGALTCAADKPVVSDVVLPLLLTVVVLWKLGAFVSPRDAPRPNRSVEPR
jgi:membrane protease YdiL (CAAX protease family)